MSRDKTAIIVSGNKGGVGKSLLSIALVSVLTQQWGRSVSVLDGDGRSPDVFRCARHKIPAQKADFRRLRPNWPGDPFDAEYEWLIDALLQGSDILVINTPDGADDTLLEWFRQTLSFMQEDGYNFKLLYLMNARGDGLELLPKMAEEFSHLIPVRNLFFDMAGEGQWKVFGPFETMFDMVPSFPRLRPWEANELMRLNYLPHEYIDESRFPGLSRQRILNWLLAVGEEMSDAIFNQRPNARAAPLDTL